MYCIKPWSLFLSSLVREQVLCYNWLSPRKLLLSTVMQTWVVLMLTAEMWSWQVYKLHSLVSSYKNWGIKVTLFIQRKIRRVKEHNVCISSKIFQDKSFFISCSCSQTPKTWGWKDDHAGSKTTRNDTLVLALIAAKYSKTQNWGSGGVVVGTPLKNGTIKFG